MRTWTACRPDSLNLDEVMAENEIYNRAKLEALTNHALRFSCAVQIVVSRKLRSSRQVQTTFFNRFDFQQNLKQVKPILDAYCEGSLSLSETEVVMKPFVIEGLRGIQVMDTLFLTREALLSIQKIQI